MNTKAGSVSVIITTKNEESNIRNCLESIKRQSFCQEDIEIIVVDNASTDRTKEISRDYTNKVLDYGPERSAQRNRGVKEAQGKYILYLDSDMILSEAVVKECVELCETKGTIALYIPEKILGNGYWSRVRDFERSFYNATCVDCARFIRRDKFLEIGGFDEALTGPEDWDFNRRIREFKEIDIINAPIYHNESAFSFSGLLHKKSYYSKSFARYVQKWGKSDKVVIKQLGFIYRYFGVFFENGKWKRLAAHPVLTMGTYFLRILVGIAYLRIMLNLMQIRIFLAERQQKSAS